MSKYQPPLSDADRLGFLRRAAQTGRDHWAAKTPFVEEDLLDDIDAFIPQFNTAFGLVTERFDVRSREIAERVQAIEHVKTYSRDLCEVVKRRVFRCNEPVSVLEAYQMTQDGSLPQPTTQEGWLELGDAIAAGDAKAVAQGHPAAVCPTAAELTAMLAAARKEAGEGAAAETAYALAQEAVAGLRPRADELIAEVVDQVRYSTRKKEASLQRRILRLYGAQFHYLPGETPDEEPVTEMATAAA